MYLVDQMHRASVLSLEICSFLLQFNPVLGALYKPLERGLAATFTPVTIMAETNWGLRSFAGASGIGEILRCQTVQPDHKPFHNNKTSSACP